MELLFYTAKNTPRTKYIVDVLLPAAGIHNYQITTEISLFKNFTGAKINYSSQPICSDEIWLQPVALLFENNITSQGINCFKWNNTKAFFKTEGDFPFDIFSASFYLLTRYEEYLLHSLDEYGRYAHINSLAYKEDFLHLPLVNIWLQGFVDIIKKKFPSLKLDPPSFQFIPTYDIDIAWCYLNKGLVRNFGGAIRNLVKGGWQTLKQRIEVLSGNKKDPFDIYSSLDGSHQQYNLNPLYFFLLAKHNKQYDKNISPSKPQLRQLIKDLAAKYNVGIHPSWQSGDDTTLLPEEIKTLENITATVVKNSRQHYIRMTLPQTYRHLLNENIIADFSMGYGSINGFRASYCQAYLWYDLEKEEVTKLTIYPFCYMEANSHYEQHYTLEQSREEMEHYYNITKQVNGLLITIFHNHTLGNQQLFKGWKEMYEVFLQQHNPF